MPQPIDVGAVLGGRYKVTGLVLTSADGDVVLDGTDQVLNRSVSILMASASNASQVATSAREIATGERYGAMQVLDLGISDGSTYLITNTANPADLLDLVIQRDEPFVEPFFTDTLGSEIFGVSRSTEPQVYEDDDEYYEELRAQQEKSPGNRSGKLSGLKARFGKSGQGGPAAGAGAAAGAAESGAGSAAADTGEMAPAGQGEDTGEFPSADAGAESGTARTAGHPADASTRAQPAASPAEPQAKASPKVTLWGPETDGSQSAAGTPSSSGGKGATRADAPQPPTGVLGAAGAGAIAGAGGTAGAEAAAGPAGTAGTAGALSTPGSAAAAGANGAATDGFGRPASTFPASARTFSDRYAEDEYADDEYDDEAGGGRKYARLIGGALLLAAVLVVAVVFAFNTLGNQEPGPVAGDTPSSSAPVESPSSASSPATSSKPPVVAPEIAGVTRLVPGNQALNAETDSTLAKAIDGSQGSFYRSYTYTKPNFGGFASNMVLVVELEEESDVSSVELSGLNGTGGSFQIHVGDTNDLGSSEEVGSGSFTGPTVTVPVAGEDSQPVKAKYVFVNVTELPKLASSTNSSRPYGLQIGEIKVS